MIQALGKPDWSRIHRGESPGFWKPLLTPLSWLYGLGIAARQGAYGRGLLKAKSLEGMVLSVGNLTTGGTGKTPAVIMLGKWAANEGYRVAVLSRGYGGRYRDNVLEVSDGTTLHTDSVVSGDEPYVLARNLRGIPVVVSHRRYLAGRYARDKFASTFFILDDGFQHVKLKRDLDLVLIDAGDPFGNRRLLPLGPLREPMDHLARAGAFIVTRYRGDGASAETVRLLHRRFPSIPVVFADHVPKQVVFPGIGETYEVAFLRDRRVVAFAAIARPEHFHQTLVRLGAHVVHFEGFKDHHLFTQEELTRLERAAVKGEADCIVTTEKDWARLRTHADACAQMGYLQIEFQLLPGGEALLSAIRDVARNRGVG